MPSEPRIRQFDTDDTLPKLVTLTEIPRSEPPSHFLRNFRDTLDLRDKDFPPLGVFLILLFIRYSFPQQSCDVIFHGGLALGGKELARLAAIVVVLLDPCGELVVGI